MVELWNNRDFYNSFVLSMILLNWLLFLALLCNGELMQEEFPKRCIVSKCPLSIVFVKPNDLITLDVFINEDYMYEYE